ETSASALAWSMYLLALDQDTQSRLATEAETVLGARQPEFTDVKKLVFTRDVFREVLRLYPPVPMMIRTSSKPETFRKREVRVGSHIVISPWHLGRHEAIWDNPDCFDPTRWQTDNGKAGFRSAFIPFSSGPRVCTGAGFAMVEGVLLLAMLARNFHFDIVDSLEPVPVAHLTVRSRDGIHLNISRRNPPLP
ncbi:MAG: cytochrome P450, partial [Paracoccaceae bacterium]